jgi:hypothetical protein
MSLKALRATAKERAAKPLPKAARRSRAKVQEVYVQVRRPDGNQPGQVAPIYFTVEDGLLTITDENGAATKGEPYTLKPGEDAVSMARAIGGAQLREAFTGFNRPLSYSGTAGIV